MEEDIERGARRICKIFSTLWMLKLLVFLAFSIFTLIGIAGVLVLLHHHLFAAGYLVASAVFLTFLFGIFLVSILPKIKL